MSGLNRFKNRTLSQRVFTLGSASTLAICAASGTATYAQDVQDPEVTQEPDAAAAADPAIDGDIITVTGYRAALNDAQNIKRNANTFVDVISAEDIGALPDRSVAEALQRVPGVNIARFEKASDPDRFSVEGTGVIIRGLPFVRSELNGRDIFSANGGRVLSFNDVSPELLGRVEVFKNATASMIDGGIAGTVNLVTRKPLDKDGFHIAGTIEANYGDLAKEWSPGFSVLASTTYENDAGRLGFQLGYAQSELITRTDASQLTDPCYRADTLTGGCIRAGATDDASNFPPADTVIVPKGAGVRTTTLTRDREAWSAVLQYEDPTGDFVATFEWLRAETRPQLNEFAIIAQVNDDNLFSVPQAGTDFTFDSNGQFQSGVLTENIGLGIPTEYLRFQRQDKSVTEDFSFDVKWNVTDRLSFNFEAQRISSSRNADALIGAMQNFTDIAVDVSSATPQVTFLPPSGADADYISDPGEAYYWFLIDSQIRNEGELDSYRADLDYDVSDVGFLRKVSVGARWAERTRVTRDSKFGNWGNLSAPWTGGGAVYADDYPAAAQLRDPFASFQRGNAPVPTPGGAAIFFGGDDLIEEYRSRVTEGQGRDITGRSQTPNAWGPIYNRNETDINGNVIPCDPFCSSEISDVEEQSRAAYIQADFGADDLFGNGWTLDGNIGVRYVETTIRTEGLIGFPTLDGFELDVNGEIDLAATCTAAAGAPNGAPGYCQLSPARQAEFLSVYGTAPLVDDTDLTFENWLPSFNAKLDVGGGLLFRVAVSKGIFRPDLADYQSGGRIGDNTNNLRQGGTLDTGPLFNVDTGNRFLTATKSWNYDLSAEWYFDDVGSVTASLFLKEISGIVAPGSAVRSITTADGATVDVRFDRPSNDSGGTLKGIELAYQQTYDFLPGILGGLGSQLTYTYVDAGDFFNPDAEGDDSPIALGLPLSGASKHTVNATVFYEGSKLSLRAAYNWRSSFLQTPRDDIFPFSPIYSESTGQLDASIFYSITDAVKVGVQGVNLLDEVTRTSQVVDFDGTRLPRSAFRNDRRFTFLARFDF